MMSVLLIISSTACSCGDRLSGLAGSKAQATLQPTAKPTTNAPAMVIPKQANTNFDGEFSEQEITRLISTELIKEAGDYVTGFEVKITPEAMVATVQVNAKELNVKFGVVVSGVPQVVDGKAYLQVTQITLDNTLSGWTRLSAKSLVQGMIDQYAGENGIPIDIDNLRIDEVQLRSGALYVRGKTL